MAGVQLKINHRLPASTIVEVLLSMVIIMVVFTLAIGIVTNVQRLSLSAKKIKAQAILNGELIALTRSPVMLKETKKLDDLRLDEEIIIYQDNDSLYQISLTAYDVNQEKLAEVKEVVYAVR